MSKFWLLHSRREYRFFLLHLSCWCLLIFSELGFVTYSNGKLEPWPVYLCYYSINIAFCYVLTWFFQKAFQQKLSWTVALPGYVCLWAGYFILKLSADLLLYTTVLNTALQPVYLKKFLLVNFVRGNFFNMLAAFYAIASMTAGYRKKAIESNNALLQQQLNPHLMFNALNLIYSKVYEYSETAARVVWLLSEITRYSLDASRSGAQASLAVELAQVKHLIELNRLRYNRAVYLDVHMSGSFETTKMIPLILLTLTENIFKHGNLLSEKCPAQLFITMENNRLNYYCRNLVRTKSKYQNTGHIGLTNVKLRLEHSYPDRHVLAYSLHKEIFELSLKINL